MPEQQSVASIFIQRWKASSAAERANYALFLSELADLLGVPRPDPAQADVRKNAYTIDRSVQLPSGAGKTTTNYIDLYKRGCFVLEAKQGSNAPAVDADDWTGEQHRLKTGIARLETLRCVQVSKCSVISNKLWLYGS